MTTNRRQFLKAAAAIPAAIGVGAATAEQLLAAATGDRRYVGRAPKPLNILILGGTGQTGPFQVKYAIDRGHKVTVFNRGKREAELPASVVHLTGDRNTKDLEALKGKDWDVVIDNPTTLPHWVRDAGEILKGHTKQYIFISTISVYANEDKRGLDEDAAVLPYTGADYLAETMETFSKSGGQLYGPLKALSEKEAEKWFPGMTTVIRPGLISGPRDMTGRFTYWPVRIEEGGEVLAPNSPNDPAQIIDGRDLAEWTVRCAENHTIGVFNATGPKNKMTIGSMLDGIKKAINSNATFTWADAAFLAEQKVNPWSDMPVWFPPNSAFSGVLDVSVKRAVDKGLTYRSLAETSRDMLTWYHAQPADQQPKLRGTLSKEKEKEVLAAWHAKQGK